MVPRSGQNHHLDHPNSGRWVLKWYSQMIEIMTWTILNQEGERSNGTQKWSKSHDPFSLNRKVTDRMVPKSGQTHHFHHPKSGRWFGWTKFPLQRSKFGGSLEIWWVAWNYFPEESPHKAAVLAPIPARLISPFPCSPPVLNSASECERISPLVYIPVPRQRWDNVVM